MKLQASEHRWSKKQSKLTQISSELAKTLHLVPHTQEGEGEAANGLPVAMPLPASGCKDPVNPRGIQTPEGWGSSPQGY